MKKLIFIICLGVAASTVSFGQDMPQFDADRLPLNAAKPEAFVHAGWKVEEVVKGDLNGDGKPDAAIKLTNGVKDRDGASGDRVLVIAFNEAGKWQRIATSAGILQCMECGGSYYGSVAAPANVTIVKGVLVIENVHGSRSVDTSRYRFRYEDRSGRFLLIGYDFVDDDRGTGSWVNESTNYSTGVRITRSGKGKRSSAKRAVIKPSKIYIEDADQDELEGEALQRNGLG